MKVTAWNFAFFPVLLLPVLLSSCPADVGGYTWIPKSVTLSLTIQNETTTTASVKIRHRYAVGSDSDSIAIKTTYSEWSEPQTIAAAGEIEVPDFILIDSSVKRILWHDGSSSFEIAVESADVVRKIAGFATEDESFKTSGLCEFLIDSNDYSRFAWLQSKKKLYGFSNNSTQTLIAF